MSEKKWKLKKEAPKEFFEKFKEYPKVIAQLLYNRGIDEKEKAEQFFHPDYEKDLKDPLLILGVKKAIRRIEKAIKEKEKIVIYHDYDADGVCGSIVIASTLKEMGVKFKTYTPDRLTEGYGLNKAAIKKIAEEGVDLLITVDCGITNVEEVAYLNELGADVIIVDHHLPGEVLPPAHSIINPKQKECEYEFKDMCAAGVAFKLCHAIIHDLGKEYGIKPGFEKWLLDVVAVATIADMMPLLGENRTLVKYGLLVLKKTKRKGLKKLIGSSVRSTRGVSANSIAFFVAPMINATSRMTHASTSYELLSTEDEDEAERLFYNVQKANDDRRKYVEEATKEAVYWIEKDLDKNKKLPEVIFMGSDEWTPGIVGLIAGKLTEKYQRPSFIYGRVGEILKGSCRGLNGFNVVEAMDYCAKKDPELFKNFGGHKMAGGFSIYEDKKEKFQKLLQEAGDKLLTKEAKENILEVESEILHDEIAYDMYKHLSLFEPYGQGNTMPNFLGKGFLVQDSKLVGNGSKHLKLTLKTELQSGKVAFFDAVGFRMPEFFEKVKKGDKIDIVFNIEENEWNGRKNLQLVLKDIKLS